MSVETEKALVRSLYDGGLTIARIAQQVGKSAGWVYSRLNDKYAPKRRRETAEAPLEELGELPGNHLLGTELQEVRALRASGMTYEQIAAKCGRSIYWVHTRLRGKYRPHDARTERLFQEEAVVPFLKGCGHTDLIECQRTKYGDFVLEADVTSRLGEDRWITEVKVSAKGHELHTAIGQLILYKCLHPDGHAAKLQIVLPAAARPARFDAAFVASVAEIARIGIAFIPWVDGEALEQSTP